MAFLSVRKEYICSSELEVKRKKAEYDALFISKLTEIRPSLANVRYFSKKLRETTIKQIGQPVILRSMKGSSCPP